MKKPTLVKLKIAERVGLSNVLPQQGNAITLRILQDLRRDLSFTEEEMTKFKMTTTRTPDGSGAYMVWDEDFKDETKEIEIGEFAMGVIVRQLKKFDREQKLDVNTLPLYEIFVEEKKEDA